MKDIKETKDSEIITEEFLMSVSGEMELSIVESILRAEGIPMIRRARARAILFRFIIFPISEWYCMFPAKICKEPKTPCKRATISKRMKQLSRANWINYTSRMTKNNAFNTIRYALPSIFKPHGFLGIRLVSARAGAIYIISEEWRKRVDFFENTSRQRHKQNRMQDTA